MQIRLSKSILFISSALLTTISFAQTPDELRNKVASAQADRMMQSSRMNSEDEAVLTKGHYDAKLTAKTFHWNNASIKNIPLNKIEHLKLQYENALYDYFQQTAELHGGNKSSISDVILTKLHDTGRGALIAEFPQKINNIEVFGRTIKVMINRKNEYVASSGYFAPTSKKPSLDFALNSRDVLELGFAQQTGEEIYLNSTIENQSDEQFKNVDQATFSEGYRLGAQSRAKKVYFSQQNNELIPAYYVEIISSKIGDRNSSAYSYIIDAETGKVLFKNNLIAHSNTTYNVFADPANGNFPFDGPQGNDLTPHPTSNIADTPPVGDTYTTPEMVTIDFAGISNSDPWLTDSQTTTLGNNVSAYADISGDDGFDAEDVQPEMTSPNTFDYAFSPFGDGLIGDGQKFAVVNLFYVNNFLHDWFYDNGFDENAGNAQNSNFSRGGVEGDRLLVEAQDSDGINNANMLTPSDGSSPRMQMYVWDFLSAAGMTVDGVSNISTGLSIFGPQEFNVTATMSLADDGVDPGADACTAISTDLTGLIGIVDRGSCDFVVKVKNAQDAGAVGVIVVNNVATAVGTSGLVNMDGEDATITTPSLFVTLEKGTEIKAALANNASLEANMVNIAKPLDGTLDNAIVAHEWAHYLSNRLVGNANGLTNNQGRSMGEGWSDFVALLMLARETDNQVAGNDLFQGVYSGTTFVGNAYYGIRRVPTTRDMTKNALTFKHIEDGVALPDTHPVAFGASGASNSAVHNTGEVWAVTLWDIFVGLINDLGYTFEQAREVMKDYLIAGMKMTPNAPTMLEARDALLAAAIANEINGVNDFDIMRAAFTRRGMGASAIAPDRNSEGHSDVSEDFTAGVDAQSNIVLESASIDVASCDIDGVLDTGESATISLTYKNFSHGALPQFDVNLTSPADVTFSTETVTVDSLSAFGDSVTKTFDVTLNSASLMEEINIMASVAQIGASPDDYVEPSPLTVSLTSNFDFSQTAYTDDMSVAASSNFDWSVEADDQLTTFKVEDGQWYGVDNGLPGSSSLTTPVIKVAATGDFTLDFEHYYSFESSFNDEGAFEYWDGAVVEISIDGAEWVDVTSIGGTLSDAYDGAIVATNDVLGGRSAYAGSSSESLTMTANRLTLAEGIVNGRDIRIRFRIGTDQFVGDFGWLVDNVVINNAIVPMFSEIVVENNVCLSGSAPTVSAGADVNFKVVSSADLAFDLIGTATDADDDVVTVEWTQRAGPAVTINNATSLAADFTVAAPTDTVNLVFELTATDGTYVTSDTVTVTLAINQAPIVSTSNSIVAEGATASLTAIGVDNDGDSLTYSWVQTAGPTVSLTGADTANATFIAPQVNTDTTLSFEVIASDGFLESTAATADVTVRNNTAPTVTTSNRTVNEGASVLLTSTATDAEGDTLTYIWTQTSGTTVVLTNADTSSVSFTAPQVTATTTLTFNVVVNDGVSDSIPATATVTVNNRTETTAPSSGGGGGGSTPMPLLIMLAFYAGLVRRKQRLK